MRILSSSVFLILIAAHTWAQSAYVRVSQIGYETAYPPFRAYLMSTVAETGATFAVLNAAGDTVYSGPVGALLGTWSNSATLSYSVYALDFTVPAATA